MMNQANGDDRRIVVAWTARNTRKQRWAMAQARLTDATIDVVSAWQNLLIGEYSFGWSPALYEGESMATITEKVLTNTVAEVTGQQHQPVEIHTRAVQGHPAHVLLEAAVGAQLLVVGTRGHGTFAGILLGSVSQHCVQHAPCPVVVIPQQPALSA